MQVFLACITTAVCGLAVATNIANSSVYEQYANEIKCKYAQFDYSSSGLCQQSDELGGAEASSENSVQTENSTDNASVNASKTEREASIDKVISTAKSLLGTPYVWLGVYPDDEGMDCASFTWYCYSQLGIDIGFETYDQMNVGYEVKSLAEAKPGDIILMYYGIAPNYDPQLPEHVALYAGGGMIYEEPQAGGVCQYVSFWSKHTTKIQIRRIIAD